MGKGLRLIEGRHPRLCHTAVRTALLFVGRLDCSLYCTVHRFTPFVTGLVEH